MDRRITLAQAALQAGRLPQAEDHCRAILNDRPDDPDALHLLGLLRRRGGLPEDAERLLRRSIVAAPQRAEFHANLGNLLRALQRPAEAETAYRRALEIDPRLRNARLGLARLLNEVGQPAAAEREARTAIHADRRDAESWAALGVALRAQDRLADAEQAYRTALSLQPGYAVARHNLGALLSMLQRSEESLQELERAAAGGARGRELEFNRGRALADLSRFDEAERAWLAALQFDPGNVETLVELAKLRFMRGDPDFAREFAVAAKARPNDRRIIGAHADLLRRAGDPAAAERLLRDLHQRHGPGADLSAALAVVLHELGRYDEALSFARSAAREAADQPGRAEALLGALLAVGDGAEALEIARRERARAPLDQRWIAYEASALRLLGRAEYRDLYDYARFVRSYDLPVPSGWASLAALNTDLATVLGERHRLRSHPLDQSLRHGTQTPRSLLRDDHPAIQAFLRALSAPIADYRASVAADRDHPLTARNAGETRFAGCWSVRLSRGGYHINHTHPSGWISSAYYVDVPDEVADVEAQSGWIKFGEPGLHVPGAGPEHLVQPRAGRLVLFPSYMWHGTTPIHGDQPRLTIAFDVVPGDAS